MKLGAIVVGLVLMVVGAMGTELVVTSLPGSAYQKCYQRLMDQKYLDREVASRVSHINCTWRREYFEERGMASTYDEIEADVLPVTIEIDNSRYAGGILGFLLGYWLMARRRPAVKASDQSDDGGSGADTTY